MQPLTATADSRRTGRHLFPGVLLLKLSPHTDMRGTLTEVYREEWSSGVSAAQINVVESRARVLRGAHVHVRHADYLIVPQGKALVGLHDSRIASPTFKGTLVLELGADEPAALIVPPGVVHTLYFPLDSLLLTIESDTYDVGDEIRCCWRDPELRMPWRIEHPLLSEADATAPGYAEMIKRIEPFQSSFLPWPTRDAPPFL